MPRSSLNILLLVSGILLGSCVKHFPNEPKLNRLPTTRLWVRSDQDSTLGDTFSRQHMFWYGEDPDGRVVGYLLAIGNYKPPLKRLPSPDTLPYVWTTRTDSVVALPLLLAHDVFTVVVRAVDDRFRPVVVLDGKPAVIPDGARIRMIPQPYWDRDSNGVPGADISLPSLKDAADSVGAIQPLPIRNQPPTVQFAANPVDSVTIEPPETTFTVATFSWVGHDPDGDNTIKLYQIALNDTSNPGGWFTLNGTANSVTLSVPRSVSDAATDTVSADVYTGTYPGLQSKGKIRGLRLNGNNVFHLRARDVADSTSKVAKLPSTSAKRWYVKKPSSRMLVVSDYIATDKYAVVAYYRKLLSDQSILGGTLGSFNVLDAGLGLSSIEKSTQTVNQKYGSLVPVNLNPALILTLKLFDIVFWFSDLYPSFRPAQIGLFYYTQAGGKVIFSTTFPVGTISFPDVRALNDFAPIDSVTTDTISTTTNHTNADNRIPSRTKVLPMSPGYPILAVDTVTVTGGTLSFYTGGAIRRVYNRADSRYIYQLDTSINVPSRYAGKPEVGVIDNAKRFVFMAVPLHVLNGGQRNLIPFFRKVIVDEFGLQ